LFNQRARRPALLMAVLCLIVLGATPAFAGAGGRPTVAPGRSGVAPIVGLDAAGVIADHYIVVFSKGASKAHVESAAGAAKRAGGKVSHVYTAALRGFAARLPAAALNGIVHNPNVEFIEADQTVTLEATQSPATWGLDRIDQRNQPLSNSYTYNFTGAGVKAYIIDTGIRFAHNDFGGRAFSGFDSVDGGSADDCNGHGTHVAGTVGGSTYGVAKGVSLVGVRVLNCSGSGTNSGVISGINWVTGDHQAGQPAVANMSLGGGVSSSLDTAVANSIADGVTYAIAAGNSNANACNYSPARVAAAITVGATTSSDARSSFSNYGTCLDIFAPGSSITSAWYTSNTATNTISGTSMATPHVAGAAALYLQSSPSASPASVRDQLVNTSTTGLITNPGSGSANRLLYTLGGSNPTPTPTPTPTPPPAGCGLPQTFSGTLSGTNDYDLHPNGTYFYTANSGTHRGCLTGPAGTDFDIYLRKWNGFSWATVAQGIGTTSTENVTYNGTAGYYYWEVRSYSGSGSYTFQMGRP
jgi:subtilisin family serine protease